MDRWLLVYVCSMESMCVFAPLADDIDWARIGSGADLEPYEPGPQAFARWVAPAPCTGVTETRMEFESFVGRRVTGSRVTRADELRELLAALPHVPETTTTVDVVGITQVDAERDMVRRSTPSHVRTVTFRADHRCPPSHGSHRPSPPRRSCTHLCKTCVLNFSLSNGTVDA